MWGLYVDYRRNSVGHMCNVAGVFVHGHMPLILTSACGHTVHYTEFI